MEEDYDEFGCNELEDYDDAEKTITVKCRDSNNTILKILNYLEEVGNLGHSFLIILDPEDQESKKVLLWDGDGSDYIESIEVN